MHNVGWNMGWWNHTGEGMKPVVNWDEDVTQFLAEVRMGKRKNMRTL